MIRVKLINITYSVDTGVYGGVKIQVLLELQPNNPENSELGTGAGTQKKSFPILYDANGKFLKARLDLLGMYYANQNAWYGNPNTIGWLSPEAFEHKYFKNLEGFVVHDTV